MNADITSLINQIMATAIQVNDEGYYHLFVDYMGHIGAVSVRAQDASTHYDGSRHSHVINEWISLSGIQGDPVVKLGKVRDRVQCLLTQESTAWKA